MSDECVAGNHDWRRGALNDWDDVTFCGRSGCQQWQQVHHNVRGKNPNFENTQARRGRR
jgi:hypothetical protein